MRYAMTLAGALMALGAAGTLTGCDDGNAGTGEPRALVDIGDAGAQCADGGVVVRSGVDRDGDGVLDSAEIEIEELLCDELVAMPPAASSLLRVDQEPRGANCPFGGRAVHAGVDDDGDGVLQDAEITDTAYACDAGTPAGFSLLSRYQIPTGTVAEIVAVSPGGATLAYTNGALGTVEMVDISDPAKPAFQGEVIVSDEVANAGAGEPTSVAFTPDGTYAVVAVKDTADPIASADPGTLVFIDLIDRADLRIAGRVTLGVGPDSVEVTPDGARVLVAIEDEEDTDQPEVAQARPGSVQVVTIDYADPSLSAVATVAIEPTVGNSVADPQPEFIDVSPDGTTAVVTLQENNALAVLDLTATPPVVTRYIDAGVVERFAADLTDDGAVALAPATFAGRREPDGVCFLPGGVHFLTANEGDTSLGDFVAGQYSGGRGFSIFDIHGNLVFEVGDELDRVAVRNGMYPDGRSEKRGLEVEGCHVATFGARALAFVLGERNSAVFVYDVTDPAAPRFVQLLPAPLRPESAASVAAQGLLIVAGEGQGGHGGGIWIYRGVASAEERERYPEGVMRAVAGVEGISFGAIGGLVRDASANTLLAVPDERFAALRLWTLAPDVAAGRVRVMSERPITESDGVTPIVGYDPEGLAANPEGGLVMVTEGKAGNGSDETERNRLLFLDDKGVLDPDHGASGIVDLPVDLWARLPKQGLSGVSVVDTEPDARGGLEVLVSFSRPLTAGADDLEAERNLARIGHYDVDTGTWAFYFYPLESDLVAVDPAAMVVADIAHLGGDRVAVIERDQLQGGAAQVKRIYSFALSSATAGDIDDPLDKTMVADLLGGAFRFDLAQADALAPGADGLWLANDNDGGALATWLMRLPLP